MACVSGCYYCLASRACSRRDRKAARSSRRNFWAPHVICGRAFGDVPERVSERRQVSDLQIELLRTRMQGVAR